MNFDLSSPFFWGVGVTLAVLGIATLLTRKRRSMFDGVPNPNTILARVDEWQMPETAFNNRRNSVRREGSPVMILIASNALRTGKDSGYVIDRSTGGLRIAMNLAMAPGSILQVRAHNAPDTIPWVTVIVRNCVQVGKLYELGCAFEKTPPWNVLLLFG